MVAATPNSELVWGEGRPAPFARMSPEEQFLRDRSTYLAPDIKGRLRLVCRLLLGMIVNLSFVTALAILAGRLLGWFAGEVLPDPLRPGVHTGNWHVKAWMFGTGIVAGFGLLLLLVTATVLMPPSRNVRIFRAGLVVMGAAAIVFGVVVAAPAVIIGVRNAAAGLEERFRLPALARQVARDLALVTDGERLAAQRAHSHAGLRGDRRQRVAEGHRIGAQAIGRRVEREVDR